MWGFGLLLPVVVLLAGCSSLSVVGCGTADNEDRRTPLEKAAQEGDAAEVARLLDSDADPNDKAGMYPSPLVGAMFGAGNAEVVRILLAAGADPHGRAEEDGRIWATPLWHAANSGDVERVRLLLDAGASVEQPCCTQFNAAALEASVADLLAEHGFDLMAVDTQGRNQLHVALAPPVTPQIEGIEYLVRVGVPLDARDRSGKTPLDYWREPRYFEAHWIQTWLLERVVGGSHFEEERENRAEISYFLEKTGAELQTGRWTGE